MCPEMSVMDLRLKLLIGDLTFLEIKFISTNLQPPKSDTHTAEAVTCNATELMPCLEAITSSTPPSETCCSKLREQTPCLCGYLEDPTLKPLANNPNTAKVASTCGVAYSQC
ncbi:non-specific lipid-transfer protein 2-like [Durio zibethinus]|uniref:Non-specific lipid-transfer protein 2-like n=1 Tax=Durio zibethinus TaxID=66656 RepID=A0A6P6AM00_DURZI|nr:non-specific lipid-transfer protein 2-like [Durio zibethinus]